MSLVCHRIAALSIVVALAGPIATTASAQQDTVQVDVSGPGPITVLRNGHAIVPGTMPGNRAPAVLGLGHAGQLFIEPADAVSAGAGASAGMQRRNPRPTGSPADTGLSNIFFIRRVPVGTTDFAPLARPGAATVDTWTERVMTNDESGADPESPVTIWTGTVYGN